MARNEICRSPAFEFMIENGGADFERIQHAHAVDFGENVADHVSFGIDVEKLAEWVVGGAVGKVAAESVAGIVAAAQNIAEAIGEQRQNSGERGNGVGNISVVKIFEQGLGVNFREFWSYGEDRFDVGGEVEISVVQRVVQRFLAQAVAGEGELALGLS